MKTIRIKILFFLLFAIFSIAIQAKVAPIELENLAKQSDLIIIGKILSVKKNDKEDVAKVEVLKILKGNSQNQIFLSVTKTWSCDVSYAEAGETALLFLHKFQIRPNFRRNLEDASEVKKQVDAEIGKNNLYQISYSGYGRMKVEKKEGSDYVSIIYGQIITPSKVKVTEKYIRQYYFVNWAKLDDIIEEIAKTSNEIPFDNLDNSAKADESLKKILAFRGVKDDVFVKVRFDKPNYSNSQFIEPIQISFFEKILSFTNN